MDDTTACKTVTVNNPQGLHFRVADLFVKMASRFASKIELAKGGRKIDGKSILAIVTLAAEQGTRLSIEATGHDAEAALNALAELVEQGYTDEEDGEQDQQEDIHGVGRPQKDDNSQPT